MDPARLTERRADIERLAAEGWYQRPGLEAMELEWLLHPEDWAETHSILVCALSCFRAEPDDLSLPGDPHGLIAPFARRNHYGESVRMLKAVMSRVGAERGFTLRQVRIFSNSRIPEKPLMQAAGLSLTGANGLQIIPGLGSQFVISGACFPIPSNETAAERGPAARLPDPCPGCLRCLAACPVGAILPGGLVDPARCLQGLASLPAAFDDREKPAWGTRLYGCQACQDVCPCNAGLRESSGVRLGDVGPSIPLRAVLRRDEQGIRDMFRGTPMGLSWVSPEALLRNALMAAGNSREPSLSDLIALHERRSSAAVRDAAAYARQMCGAARAVPTCVRP